MRLPKLGDVCRWTVGGDPTARSMMMIIGFHDATIHLDRERMHVKRHVTWLDLFDVFHVVQSGWSAEDLYEGDIVNEQKCRWSPIEEWT